MKAPKIPVNPVTLELAAIGLLVGLAAFWIYSKAGADNNRDGTADGFWRNFGYDAGRAPVDATVGFFDGALDAAVDPLGGSYSDCADYKASGNRLGIIWACWPSDWFK